MKHTKGPWRVVELDSTLLIGSNQEFGDIAKIFRDKKYVEDKDGESLANAKLIASAPELLEALRNLTAWAEEVDDDGEGKEDWIQLLAAKEAIKKATN